MTFVGKILVIVIMAFSLLFLALRRWSSPRRRTGWSRRRKQKDEVDKLKKKLQDAQAAVGRRQEGARGREGSVRRQIQDLSIAPLANLQDAEQARLRPAHGGP